eukprot:gene15372-18234_t
MAKKAAAIKARPKKPVKATAPKKPAASTSKKAAAKTTKTTKATKTATAKKTSTPSSRSRSNVRPNARSTLFGKIADDWIERYDEDAELATLDLVNLIVEGGGGDALTLANFQDSFEEGAEDTCDADDAAHFPLDNKRTKALYGVFTEFMNTLTLKCQNSILYDEYLLEMLVQWSMQLSEAKARGVRYATVLTCIHITGALVHICADLKRELNLTSRQVAAEPASSTSERLRTLKENQGQLASRLKTLETMIETKFFKKVFQVRSRDLLPEIRGLCLAPLPGWIFEHPSLLLAGDYLRYLGWGLNDAAVDVRMTAIKGLITLYTSDEHITQLDTFTQKFKERVVSIASSDKVVAICVEAIQLVGIMARHELLDAPLIERVTAGYLIDNAQISRASGELIYQTLLKEADEQVASTKTTLARRNELREQQLMDVLDYLYTKSTAPEVPFYLVAALWEHAETFFTDWEFFVRFLQDVEEKDIDARQLVTIAKIISAAVKIATDAKPNVFKEQPKASKTTAAAKSEEPKTDIATHFLPVLPELLGQHKANSAFCEHIIEIAQAFNLETYISLRLQPKFGELLDAVKEIFLQDPHESLTDAVVTTLATISNGPPQLESVFKYVLLEISNGLLTAIRQATTDFEIVDKDDAKATDDILFAISVNLQKIDFLGRLFPLSAVDLHPIILPLIDGRVGSKAIEASEPRERIIMLASTCTSQLIMWEMANEVPEDTSSMAPLSDVNSTLVHIFYQFVHRMNILLESSRSSYALKHFAYKTLVEVLVLFSPRLDKTVLHIYALHVPKSYMLLEKTAPYLFEQENNKILEEIATKLMNDEEAEREREIERKKKNKSKKKKRPTRKQKKPVKGRGKKQKVATSESENEDNDEEEEEEEDEEEDGDDEDDDKGQTSEATTSESETERSDRDKKSSSRKKQKFVVEKDANGLLGKSGEKRMQDIVVATVQAIQCRILSTEMVGVILKQVAMSPGIRVVEIIREYAHQLKSQVRTARDESAFILSALKEFYLLAVSCDDDYLKQHMFERLNGLLDWLCVEFMRKNSLGWVFKDGLKFFFGKDQEDPENPEFLECVSFIIPKLSREEALTISPALLKLVDNNGNDHHVLSLKHQFRLVPESLDIERRDKQQQTIDLPQDISAPYGGLVFSSENHLTALRMNGDYNQPILKDQLPQSLTTLEFGSSFDQAIAPDTLPQSLSTIIFGQDYKQPLQPGSLPQSLTNLSFGACYNQQLVVGSLPKSLESLSFDYFYNQPILPHTLPQSLQSLTFGFRFNPFQPFSPGSLPQSLTTLDLGDSFDQPIDPGVLNQSLKSLTLGDAFNQKLEIGSLPRSLEILVFSDRFNTVIEPGVLPDSLLKLNLGTMDLFPSSLHTLISHRSDQSLLHALPNSIRHLELNVKVSEKPIEPGTLPSQLEYLYFGSRFNHEILPNSLPQTLKTNLAPLRCIGGDYLLTEEIQICHVTSLQSMFNSIDGSYK